MDGGDAGFSEVIVVTTTISPDYDRARPPSTRLAKLNFAPRAENRVTKIPKGTKRGGGG